MGVDNGKTLMMAQWVTDRVKSSHSEVIDAPSDLKHSCNWVAVNYTVTMTFKGLSVWRRGRLHSLHRFEHTQIVVEVGNCSCPNGKCYDNYRQEVHTLVDYLQYNEYESIPMFASE
mgnify:CR=1 FL=1